MSRRPNVVLLMADDHRHDALGCAGDARVHTPTLDALAAAGVRFSRTRIMGGHTPAVCVPTRAGVNTGCSPFTATRLPEGRCRGEVPEHITTLGQAFRAAGYRTAHTGKWHLSTESFERSFDCGRQVFHGGMGDHCRLPLVASWRAGTPLPDGAVAQRAHATELFSDAAIDLLGEFAQAGAPFLLSCCYTAPHDPRQAPAAWHRRFPPQSMPLPGNFLEQHPFDNGMLTIRDEQLRALPRTAMMVREEIADYYAMIGHMDANIARVLAELDRLGIRDDTIVVYTGDHGLAVGQHGLLGKQNCYEHSLGIPWLMAGPGVPVGQTCDALVQNVDILPTICALCALPVPASVDAGRSVLPSLHGETQQHRACVYSVFMDLQASLRESRWKLIRSYVGQGVSTGGRGVDRLQLFDLEADPWEIDDRSRDPGQAERVHAMQQAMRQRQHELGDPLAQRELLPV